MIALATVARGDGSRIVEPRRVVVRTAEEWRALWAAHAGPEGEAPPIDFGTEMAAAVFAGERPTAGYTIEITGVMEERGGLRIFSREARPPAGAITAQILTSPFHIVRLPRQNGEVRWGSGTRDPGSAESTDPGRPPDPTLRQAQSAPSTSKGASRIPETGSSSGLSTPVASALSYLAGPVSGALILLAEHRNRAIRFHAWQSILALGGVWIIVLALYVAALGSLFISAAAFTPLLMLSTLGFGASIVLWLVCMVKAYQGRPFKLPYAGDRAARYANTRAAD